MTDTLMHYGTPRHSGRYPWGSGENPYQHEKGFSGYVNDLRKKGWSDSEIAKGMGMTINEMRSEISLEGEKKKAADIAQAQRLYDKGYSKVQIAKRLNLSEGTVRNYLKNSTADSVNKIDKTAEMLKKNVNSRRYLDIGAGVERSESLGISSYQLQNAIAKLEKEGYAVRKIQINQLGTNGQKTTMKILVPEGVEARDIYQHKDRIKTIDSYTNDKGRTWNDIKPPVNLSSDRVKINYREDKGAEKDGVIELRRGVDELSLNGSRYAQVRIAVDGTHYLKGMAIYSDNMPKGVDVVFNTNKSKAEYPNKMDVLKKMETGDAPFGATITRQNTYTDKTGKEHQGVLNIVNEEGKWGEWKKTIASQMLSKQEPELAKRQLNMSYYKAQNEFEELKSLTNPVVKEQLLKSFADNCDSATVHLKAYAFRRQASQVILPINSLKENEIYAPNYRNGENVVLVRYPHGGIFEIPRLKVNNNNQEGKRVITPSGKDAVGINYKVAQRLSGADFDGDTVLVIPVNRNTKIKTAEPLKGLKDFDPQTAYPGYPGMKVMSEAHKEREMGIVSNLITDMTLKGADFDEIARAVRHSMVVIDAPKHELNYKQSYIDNNIAELKKKYQKGGASTLISQAKSEVHVPERQTLYWKVDPKTGEKIYKPTGRTTWTDKDGKIHKFTTKSTKMAETPDAYTLSSGTKMESYYADYANRMKALANEARKETFSIKQMEYDRNAAKVYKPEVDSINAKLNVALRNAPRERQAQVLANLKMEALVKDNPDLKSNTGQRRKWEQRYLDQSRTQVGSVTRKDRNITFTPKEWEAIQSGAINKTQMKKIFDNTDHDYLRDLSTPKAKVTMTKSKISRAKAMASRGMTIAEIADVLGVSTSTVSKVLNE